MFFVLLFAAGPVTLDSHAWLAVGHLRTVPAVDRPYMRYVTWLGVPKGKAAWRKGQVWWHNQLSLEQAITKPIEVAGSDGQLWAVDLRDSRWNARGWRVMARRDPYCREPWTSPAAARLLREMTDVKREELDSGEYPLVTMVRADFLFRDTLEPARGDGTDSYYDLLYATRRFPDGKDAVDFPETSDDLDEFFGVKLFLDFSEKAKIDTRVGAVVAGSRDDPINGSLVARQNRVIQIRRGVWGIAPRTFDAFRTAGKRDYIEEVTDVARGKIEADAGEFLYELPNGGQAMGLFNKAKKRVELADGRLVRPVSLDKRHPDVRTGQCWVCHAPDGGFIAPRDMFTLGDKAGIKLKTYLREDKLRVEGFFLKWEGRLQGWQAPYYSLLKETTSWGDGKPLTPTEMVKQLLEYRDWYDNPVTPEQAAVECGVDVLTFRVAMSTDITKYEYDGKVYPVLGLKRVKELAKGMSIPRDAWEADVYRSANILLRLYRESEAKR